MGPLKLLLDTCTFIWLCADPGRLSKRAREALETPPLEILLSDVSALEITLKWHAGKLTLPRPPRSWIEEQADIWKTTFVPLSRVVIYRSSELPTIHRDPFDRLLVASALETGATLVTPEAVLARYPVPCLW